MVRGGAGAMKVGQGGFWAMIERKLARLKEGHKKTASDDGSGF
ncbi:hypothetical protein JOE32_004716 [Pseudomonas sp. PvP025]|jgi:hypothetical protein|nr:hypothetical protein [Pseudomonas sp. PvP025]MDQ0397187.1 hypothetical protein [Pseudomonas sp. PvP006]